LVGRIFCGKPASTPDQVRGRLFPENALFINAAGAGLFRAGKLFCDRIDDASEKLSAIGEHGSPHRQQI